MRWERVSQSHLGGSGLCCVWQCWPGTESLLPVKAPLASTDQTPPPPVRELPPYLPSPPYQPAPTRPTFPSVIFALHSLLSSGPTEPAFQYLQQTTTFLSHLAWHRQQQGNNEPGIPRDRNSGCDTDRPGYTYELYQPPLTRPVVRASVKVFISCPA